MLKGMKLCIVLLAVLVLTFALPAAAKPLAKNVIMLIVDGCGSEHYPLARWYRGKPLALDAIRTGAIKTFVANSVVADSASAASAFATGVRTGSRVISLAPQHWEIAGLPQAQGREPLRPLATVLEGAKLLGKSTGIVVTSRVTHATSAAFYAHLPSRYQENRIMEQLVHQNLDVVMGGGGRHLLPKAKKDRRKDGQNLWNRLVQRGYQPVGNRRQLMSAKQKRVFGIFSPSHLEAALDRPHTAGDQPSLLEMTRQAITVLSKNPKGFFLLVEASQVDWANHANDPAHLVHDLLMYDKVVKLALDFARQDGQTLVLALSDHSTGGMTIGNYRSDIIYPQLTPQQVIAPIKRMRRTSRILWQKMKAKTPAEVMRVVKEYWGITIKPAEAARILVISRKALRFKQKFMPWWGIGQVVSPAYTYLGWTTHGHTGADVPLHAFGPGAPRGLIDGPQIGRAIARALGLNLKALNQRLFVPAQKAFAGSKIRQSTSGRYFLEVTWQGKKALLPANQNRLQLGSRWHDLEGLAVYLPETRKFYLPLQAVRLIKGSNQALPKVDVP